MCRILTYIFVSFWGKYQGTWSLITCKIVRNFRNWQTVSAQYILFSSHTHQQWMQVPVSPQSHQHLLSSVFQILIILIGVWWHSQCCFNLYFLDDVQTRSIFSACLFASWVVLVVCQVFGLFFNQVVYFLIVGC